MSWTLAIQIDFRPPLPYHFAVASQFAPLGLYTPVEMPLVDLPRAGHGTLNRRSSQREPVLKTLLLLALISPHRETYMYEPRHQKPVPRRHFVRRLIAHSVASLALIVASLFLGMLGYHLYEGLPWRDAFLNAAMLLGGMGPIESPRTDGGKLFAGFYALYSGLVFLVAAGLIVAPALHRMLHLFHWEERHH